MPILTVHWQEWGGWLPSYLYCIWSRYSQTFLRFHKTFRIKLNLWHKKTISWRRSHEVCGHFSNFIKRDDIQTFTCIDVYPRPPCSNTLLPLHKRLSLPTVVGSTTFNVGHRVVLLDSDVDVNKDCSPPRNRREYCSRKQRPVPQFWRTKTPKCNMIGTQFNQE